MTASVDVGARSCNAPAANSEIVCYLADDHLWLPSHVATVCERATAVDIRIAGWLRTTGPATRRDRSQRLTSAAVKASYRSTALVTATSTSSSRRYRWRANTSAPARARVT